MGSRRLRPLRPLGAALVKLAFVHKRYGLDGGTERFLEGLTRGLSARGHELAVFVARTDPRFARSRVARFHRLVCRGPSAFLKAVSLWLSTRIAVRREQYDLVVHFGRTGPQGLYRAGGGCHRTWFDLLRRKVKGSWRRRVLEWSPHHRFLLWHEEKALRSPGVVTVVPSERAREDLRAAYGKVAGTVQVLPNGVDLERFHPKLRVLFFEEARVRFGLAPEELVVLFVGGDYWRKGLDTLLKALGALERRDSVRLLVVGGDSRRSDYVALADGCGLGQRVTFVASVESIEKVYAAADVLALPTRHDPFANVTLEALASGLPVVTSGLNGATEVATSGAGFRVVEDPEDVEGFGRELADLLYADGAVGRREQARRAVESCGEGMCVDRWEGLLRQVAGGEQGG